MAITEADKLLRRLRLRHIELMSVLGSVSNMRVASEQLNLSQPAVSKMLQEIEQVFGARLFERSKAGVRPTSIGEIAVRQARIICSEVEVTADAVAAAVSGRERVLRLGTLTVTSIVPKALLALRKDRPDAVVHIREGAADVLIDLLLANKIDCVVGALPPGTVSEDLMESIAVKPVSLDWLCIVAAPGHRLVSRRRLGWKDLGDADWVLPPSHAMVRQAFVAACLQQGLQPPRPVVETLSPLTLSYLVRSDPALLGLMRSEQLRGEHQAFTLKELPVVPRVALPPLSLLTRRSRSGMAPLVDPFFRALQTAVSSDARP